MEKKKEKKPYYDFFQNTKNIPDIKYIMTSNLTQFEVTDVAELHFWYSAVSYTHLTLPTIYSV